VTHDLHNISMDSDLITAADLEEQAGIQQIEEMKIVEVRQGYELHVMLRAWLHDEMAIRQTAEGSQVVINLSEPTLRILRTRRAMEPRVFKKLTTMFSYIEEKFPSVRNVEVRLKPRPPLSPGVAKKTPAGKSSGKKPSKSSRRTTQAKNTNNT